VPPIPRTATYRSVQAGKTAGRSTCGRRVSAAGNNPASTTGPDSPHARHAQALDQDSKPVHLPSTLDAPSHVLLAGPRHRAAPRAIRNPLHQAQAHPIAPGQQENDTRRKEPFSVPRRPDLGFCARCTFYLLSWRGTESISPFARWSPVAVRHYHWPLPPRALPLTWRGRLASRAHQLMHSFWVGQRGLIG